MVKIVERLDGLPLALELASSRLRVLDLDSLAARIERRLPLLTGGARDLPERQRTLASTIEWSYDLLGPRERRLFARLSVFAGGWTLEEAEAICGDDLTRSMVSPSWSTRASFDGPSSPTGPFGSRCSRRSGNTRLTSSRAATDGNAERSSGCTQRISATWRRRPNRS